MEGGERREGGHRHCIPIRRQMEEGFTQSDRLIPHSLFSVLFFSTRMS